MAVLASTEGGLRQGGERRDGRAEH
jgi:hypothetical protein